MVVFYEGTWAGVEAASVDLNYVQGAIDIDIDEAPGDNAMLAVTFARWETPIPGTDENLLSSQWSIPETQEQVDIFDHPNSRALETAHKGWLRIIEEEVDAYVEGDDTDSPFELSEAAQLGTPSQNTLAQQLADDLLRGVRHYLIEPYILRNSRIVPPDSSLTANHVDVGKMFTLAQLQAHVFSTLGEEIPSSLIGALPSDGYWRKRKPSVTQQANGNWQIDQTFERFDAFSAYLYETAS